MKIAADYIADYIYDLGVKEIFMVSGGGMMFLSDGIAKHPKLKAICNHHEQASAMAAVSYSKYNGNLGVAYVTTGCGGTNTITGVLGAWQDNIPALFISGQSKRKENIRNSGLRLRQFGVQEADIISIVTPITKYAVMVNDPNQIAYHLDKAVYLAKSGRPGPTWLDIPLDVQGAPIDDAAITRFDSNEINKEYKEDPSSLEINQVVDLLNNAKRPIIIAGGGIRSSKALAEFKSFVEKFNIPVVASLLGASLLPSDHPLYIGRIGNKGDRAGNFAVQNSDLVMAIGSRLSVASTGHEFNTFAREAKIIAVDIDPEEHKKKTVRIDLFVNADAKKFILALGSQKLSAGNGEWAKKCLAWKIKYPVCLPEYSATKQSTNLYYFVDRLSKKLKPDSVVISDAGSSFYIVAQGLRLKEGQRHITSGGQAEMGYTLPASVGVSVARGKGEVIGITGDGSLQMNIQELQTIVYHDLPVKLFIWNNRGYQSIRTTQLKFFDGRFIGTDEASGVSLPDTKKIADAYGIKYFKMSNNKDIDKTIEKVLAYPKAVICEVMCLKDQEIIPTVASVKKEDGAMVSKPLEDMYPFLPREEFRKEMIIRPVEE